MKRRSVLALGLSAAATAALRTSRTSFGQAPSSWITLLDGTNLDRWTAIGDADWKLADGVVQADKGRGFLVSKDDYADFEIAAEFWVDSDANSGIFIRCTDPNSVSSKTGYEVNIFDTRPDPSYGTGAIVDVAKVASPIKAGGKWNTYEITAKGSTFDVTLNGVKTVVGGTDSKFPKGRVALQYGQGVVKFRKVEIKPM